MAPAAIESLDEPDLVARYFSWSAGALTLLLVAVALLSLLNGAWQATIPLLILAIPAGIATNRFGAGVPTTLRLDDTGIHRLGRYDFSLPWNEIRYAAVHPYDGNQVVVVIPREEVKHWSRTLRSKPQVLTEDLGELPTGGYVVPIYPELAWEVEHYIAGHLPGHPGFDPSRLRLTPLAGVGVLSDDATPPPPNRPTAQHDPLILRTPDPLPRRQFWIFLALGVVALAVVVQVILMGNPVGAIAVGVVGAVFCYRAWTAFRAREAVLLVNEAGIARGGTWGWQLEWQEIASARVAEFQGRDYLVVVRTQPNAPYHRSATSLRGHSFEGNALITPVPSNRREELRAGLKTFRRGRSEQ